MKLSVYSLVSLVLISTIGVCGTTDIDQQGGKRYDPGKIIPVPSTQASALVTRSILSPDPRSNFQAVVNKLMPGTGKQAVKPNTADRNQSNALQVLRDITNPKVFRVRVEQGALRRLDLDMKLPKSGLLKSVSSATVAGSLLKAWGGLLRVTVPEQQFHPLKRTGFNGRTLLYRQFSNEIPVYGSWLRFTIDEKPENFLLKHIAGRYVPALTPDFNDPRITATQAERQVAEKYGAKISKVSPPMELTVPTKLWIFDSALLASTCAKCPTVRHNPRLSWRVIFSSPRTGGAIADAFVDTDTGEILYYQARSYEQSDLNIASASNNRISNCPNLGDRDLFEGWFNEDGVCRLKPFRCRGNSCWPWAQPICAVPDTEGDDANRLAHRIYDFFDTVFPPVTDEVFDSIGLVIFPTEGDKFLVMLDYCSTDTNLDCRWENASSGTCWYGDSHVFGDGWATLNVMAHELGHTYHRAHVRSFLYAAESGAIAEHIADMVGHFAACWIGEDCDWMTGEHTVTAAGGCGRDLADPPNCGDPDHMDNILPIVPPCTSGPGGNDLCELHSNNGILNKAGFLMTEGGDHPSGVDFIRVAGIGEEKVRAIYHASIFDLPESPSFNDFADHVLDACVFLEDSRLSGVPDPGIGGDDCCQVRNAFAAVGILTADSDCNGTLDTASTDDDGDGIEDAIDNCPIPNGNQDDSDGDGVGDACDDDRDGDGFANEDDNCPDVAGSQADTDGNDTGDICDDWDGDHVINVNDNCPNTYQRQWVDEDWDDLPDHDGLGNLCDPDDDNDHIADEHDNCPLVANTHQSNSDSDEHGDACDNCDFRFNPLQENHDDDPDGDACDPDDDNDGIVDDDDICPFVDDGMGDLFICQDGYGSLGAGCPCRPELGNGSYNAPFTPAIMRGLRGEPDSAPVSPLIRKIIDRCAFMPCEEETPFTTNGFVKTVLDFRLEPPADIEMKTSVTILVSVLDDAGNRLASEETHLLVSKGEVNKPNRVTLTFDAFSAKHIIISPIFGSQKNLDLLEGGQLKMKVKMPRVHGVRKKMFVK